MRKLLIFLVPILIVGYLIDPARCVGTLGLIGIIAFVVIAWSQYERRFQESMERVRRESEGAALRVLWPRVGCTPPPYDKSYYYDEQLKIR